MRVLRAIGVEDAVRAVAGRSQWQWTRTWTGRVIAKSSPAQQAAAVAGKEVNTDGAQSFGPHGTIVVYPLRGTDLVNVVCHYDDDRAADLDAPGAVAAGRFVPYIAYLSGMPVLSIA